MSTDDDYMPIEDAPPEVQAEALRILVWAATWPDLELKTLNCPLCGEMSHPLMPSPNFHPQAVCDNEDCAAWVWDPTTDRDALMANPTVVDDDGIDGMTEGQWADQHAQDLFENGEP